MKSVPTDKAPSNIEPRDSGVQPIDYDEEAYRRYERELYRLTCIAFQPWEVRREYLAAWKPGDAAGDLADALGLRPCPARAIDAAFIRGDVLHFPEDASLAERELSILGLVCERFPAETAHLHDEAKSGRLMAAPLKAQEKSSDGT